VQKQAMKQHSILGCVGKGEERNETMRVELVLSQGQQVCACSI